MQLAACLGIKPGTPVPCNARRLHTHAQLASTLTRLILTCYTTQHKDVEGFFTRVGCLLPSYHKSYWIGLRVSEESVRREFTWLDGSKRESWRLRVFWWSCLGLVLWFGRFSCDHGLWPLGMCVMFGTSCRPGSRHACPSSSGCLSQVCHQRNDIRNYRIISGWQCW